MFRGLFCVLAVALAAVVFPIVAAAQQSSLVLEEVIVTAQFRQENLQDTPLAITAVSGDQLEKQGLQNVEDLGLVVFLAGRARSEAGLRSFPFRTGQHGDHR